jgi:hypothetical protein
MKFKQLNEGVKYNELKSLVKSTISVADFEPKVASVNEVTVVSFYTKDEFDKWKNNDPKGWQTEYKKGLAALESEEYEIIIKEPKLIRITADKLAKESLNAWFGKDSNKRKTRLLKY